MAETKIVAATGSAGGGEGNRGKEMQDALTKAVDQAYAAGITDPAKILEVKTKVRAALRAEWKKQSDEATARSKTAAEKAAGIIK